LAVSARFETRSWEKDGEKKYSSEFVVEEMQFIGGAKSKGDAPSNEPAEGEFTPLDDENLPF
jgi:single-strand DNA-binding protein